MKPLRFFTTAISVAAIALCSVAGADDGLKVSKRMTGGNSDNKLTVLPEDIGQHVSEAEHAFTDMMPFYVPMQSSSGLTGAALLAGIGSNEIDPRDYYNIDGDLVETLDVAKPLINVFIYGPWIEVEDTAFAHSFMDAFGAVSLDDGMTWKATNLSQTADMSSFTLGESDWGGGGESDKASHSLAMESWWGVPDGDPPNLVYHAIGGELPYTGPQHCIECHGSALQGTLKAPSCFQCHSRDYQEKFDEEIPDQYGPLVYYSHSAHLVDDGGQLTLEGSGVNSTAGAFVSIVNAATGDPVGDSLETAADGRFSYEIPILDAEPPCSIAAAGGYDGQSPAILVLDENGERLSQSECTGGNDELTEYPGGVYNVFLSTVGNKTLVAWPSRFCKQGQPAYSFAWPRVGGDEGQLSDDQLAKQEALVDLLDIDLEEDLYLTDLFGVAGSQRSIDFADEGYPQAGEVPFGCVWTARGVLLPGDDPRTGTEEDPVVEESYMVWTKPERLTSGRRDPNRIEVKGVAGAGFVMTWQEDPDGLRPGQGLGPGEGWSGAVAHDKTDVWYSFIPWEYFDLVETYDEDGNIVQTEYVNIAEHDLLNSGRPQAFVPMAVPMRLTNNAKCQAEYYGPDASPGTDEEPWDVTHPKYFSYCNYDVAEDYGLQDFCASTVDIPQGPNDELGAICVNEDGLPNVANTGSTRPRTSLQPSDTDGDGATDSGWVIVAAEESKGLGRYTFLPDGTECEEVQKDDPEYNPDCGADIGKNQWYFSFDMGDPATSDTADEEQGLVQNLVNQGNLLNQPEVDWRTGEFYPAISTEAMWNFGYSGGTDFEIYNTEIARRSSLLVQSYEKACTYGSGLVAISSYKQGAMRQGGPADVMLRRITVDCEDNGVCDSDNPGPGPGGVQPTIDKAKWQCKEDPKTKEETCILEVYGTVCVDGFRDPTDIVLSIDNAVTGDHLCIAKVDEDYDFSTEYEVVSAPDDAPVYYECILDPEQKPCAVVAVAGPGNTQGDGQVSEPEVVIDTDSTGLYECVGELVDE